MSEKKVAGFSYQKAESWDGRDLLVPLKAYIKIDGIRTIGYKEGVGFLSRAGKPLEGLNKNATKEAREKLMKYSDCEVYLRDWNTSYSMCSSSSSKDPITSDMIYPLADGSVDKSLFIGEFKEGLTVDQINTMRDMFCSKGYEGLIIRGKPPRARRHKWIRVKPHVTGDVFIRGFEEAVDKDTKEGLGRVGKVLTDYGKVGIFKGMSLDTLECIWESYKKDPAHYEDELIQVEFMEWTKNGKMRHAAWDQGIMRLDKDEESFDKEFINA